MSIELAAALALARLLAALKQAGMIHDAVATRIEENARYQESFKLEELSFEPGSPFLKPLHKISRDGGTKADANALSAALDDTSHEVEVALDEIKNYRAELMKIAGYEASRQLLQFFNEKDGNKWVIRAQIYMLLGSIGIEGEEKDNKKRAITLINEIKKFNEATARLTVIMQPSSKLKKST